MRISLNRILGFAILLLIVAITGGTVLAFVTHTAKPGEGLRKTDPEPGQITATDSFSAIGELRAVTKPENGKPMGISLVVTPWLSYPVGDKEFHEELSRKTPKIRSIFLSYFSKYTEKELLARGEKNIKDDLLHQINAELVLGKIRAVYFNEYIFLE